MPKKKPVINKDILSQAESIVSSVRPLITEEQFEQRRKMYIAANMEQIQELFITWLVHHAQMMTLHYFGYDCICEHVVCDEETQQHEHIHTHLCKMNMEYVNSAACPIRCPAYAPNEAVRHDPEEYMTFKLVSLGKDRTYKSEEKKQRGNR